MSSIQEPHCAVKFSSLSLQGCFCHNNIVLAQTLPRVPTQVSHLEGPSYRLLTADSCAPPSCHLTQQVKDGPWTS